MEKTELTDWLAQNKNEILNEWAHIVLPVKRSSRFLASESEDPLFHNVHGELQKLYQSLLNGSLNDGDYEAESLNRILALYEKNAEDAVSYPFKLKSILCEKLAERAPSLYHFEPEFEKMLLGAFLGYAKSREKLYEIKIKEIQSGVFAGLQPNTSCPSSMLNSPKEQ